MRVRSETHPGSSRDGEPRKQLMPTGHWDWHITTPFSQGWRVGPIVFVGGQLALDEEGKVLTAGDIQAQTGSVREHHQCSAGGRRLLVGRREAIEHVLRVRWTAERGPGVLAQDDRGPPGIPGGSRALRDPGAGSTA